MKKIIAYSMFALFINTTATAAALKDKPELLDTIKSIQTTANSCNQTMRGELIVNKLKKDFALSQDEKAAASNQHSAIYDSARKCRSDGKTKIGESAPSIISKLKEYGLIEIGKDFIIQAQTTIEATMDNQLFSAESSKLESIKNRIELELSLSN